MKYKIIKTDTHTLLVNLTAEIKEGDWWIRNNLLCNKLPIHHPQDCNKIIASTDTSLKFGEDIPTIIRYKSIPQLPTSFIQHYIEQFNIGIKLDKIMVEYTENKYNSSGVPVTWSSENNLQIVSHLKLNSNNEISIKPIKTSWSREEVTNILYKFRETYQYASNNIDVNKWISQNL